MAYKRPGGHTRTQRQGFGVSPRFHQGRRRPDRHPRLATPVPTTPLQPIIPPGFFQAGITHLYVVHVAVITNQLPIKLIKRVLDASSGRIGFKAIDEDSVVLSLEFVCHRMHELETVFRKLNRESGQDTSMCFGSLEGEVISVQDFWAKMAS